MPLKIKSIKTPTSLSDMAYEAIKEFVLSQDTHGLDGDVRLDEKALVDSLGVSRTPVREAVNRLVAEGFLKMIPRRGVFVARKSIKEIVEIQLVRSALEGLAGRLATHNINRSDIVYMRAIFSPFQNVDLMEQRHNYSKANIRFHEFIVQKSECGKLIEVASNLADHNRMIRFQTSSYQERLESSLHQHMEIIDTFEKGDGEMVEKLIRKHIDESMDYLVQKLKGDSEGQLSLGGL